MKIFLPEEKNLSEPAAALYPTLHKPFYGFSIEKNQDKGLMRKR